MKNKFLLAILFITITLTGCSSKAPTTSPSSESLTTDESEATSEIIADETSYDKVEDLEIDPSLLEPYQGEWKLFNSDIKLIVSGREVNHIYYDYKNKDEVVNIHTFYFELNEDRELVVSNSYSQPRYKLTILEDGTLSESSLPSDEEDPDIYTYISDNTTVPIIKDDPSIGMTEEQVKLSTWGYPKKKNSTTTASGTREQWVYDEGYIYIENGIVTAIQE